MMEYIDNVVIELFRNTLLKYKKDLTRDEIISLLKSERGKNIREVLEYITNKYSKNETEIRDSIEFEKFNKLFARTRIDEFPNLKAFESIPIELVEKFKIKVYNLFKDIHIFRDPLALINMIGVFGLFENDSSVKQRIDTALNIFLYQKAFSKREILRDNPFTCETTQTEYTINEELRRFIPEGIKPYLFADITENYYSFLKRMNGNMGRKINDYLTPYVRDENGYTLKKGSILYAKALIPDNFQALQTLTLSEYQSPEVDSALYNLINSYVRQQHKRYGIKPGLSLEEWKAVLSQFKEYELTYGPSDIQGLFLKTKPIYDPDFYNFFVEHQADISVSTNNFSKLSDVQKNYHQVKKYYQERGNSDPDYITIIECLREVPFEVEFGDEEFAIEVKNAGVLSEGYTYYADLLKWVRKRHTTAVPRHSKTYDFYDKEGNHYKVETKILRSTDPFNMLVGESKYIDCCQKYNDLGQMCLEHASVSKMGSIMVINIIDEESSKMLTQSWFWVNEQEGVIDNLEQTSILSEASTKQRCIYEDIVAFAVEKAAQDILIDSNAELGKFAQKRSEEIEKMANPDERKKEYERLAEILKRQSLKVITLGANYSDIIVSDYFSERATRDLHLPKDYQTEGYSDADTRYVVAGSESDITLSPDAYFEEEAIYRDERLIEFEFGGKIKNCTLKKILEIGNFTLQKFSSICEFADLYELDLATTKVMHGEDWFYLYENDGTEIRVKKFAKGLPRVADETEQQLGEILKGFQYIVNESVTALEDGSQRSMPIRVDFNDNTLNEIYSTLLTKNLIHQVGEEVIGDGDETATLRKGSSSGMKTKVLRLSTNSQAVYC